MWTLRKRFEFIMTIIYVNVAPKIRKQRHIRSRISRVREYLHVGFKNLSTSITKYKYLIPQKETQHSSTLQKVYKPFLEIKESSRSRFQVPNDPSIFTHISLLTFITDHVSIFSVRRDKSGPKIHSVVGSANSITAWRPFVLSVSVARS